MHLDVVKSNVRMPNVSVDEITSFVFYKCRPQVFVSADDLYVEEGLKQTIVSCHLRRVLCYKERCISS